jgi:hypothetical protein
MGKSGSRSCQTTQFFVIRGQIPVSGRAVYTNSCGVKDYRQETETCRP